jgi:chromosome partitioning protein
VCRSNEECLLVLLHSCLTSPTKLKKRNSKKRKIKTEKIKGDNETVKGELLSRIITVSNNKGGILKTTLTTSFAGIEAMKGNRTLLIDLDNQGNVSTTFNLDPNAFQTTIYDVLIDGVGMEQAIVPIHSHIDLLPSNHFMAQFEIDALRSKTIPSELLINLLRHRTKDFDFSPYDFVLIDVPPTLSLILANALSISNEIIIPVQPEPYAVSSLIQTVNAIKHTMTHLGLTVRINSIVLTNVENVNIHTHYITEIRKWAATEGIKVANEVIYKSKMVPDFLSMYNVPITMGEFTKKGESKYNKVKNNFEKVWSEIK